MPTRPPHGSWANAQSQQNIAYIRQMLAELRSVAESEKADMLCYLIEMAYLEADDVLAGLRSLDVARKSN
ncbi:hypothetical protein [Hoeflea ulvae]|uniref:DUF2783 domain-containing protein n=1 Tax=Hoeflea ulvae TaxID=2983764 RepID=A0ABT3YFJ7_9HYPH|nr:hypothetical protein [Hoeflea ulvae]MCY0094660.1 hypothetical protein [Hoeflea ulvae]